MGHDRKAIAAVVEMEYGGIAEFLVAHGFGPDGKSPLDELAARRGGSPVRGAVAGPAPERVRAVARETWSKLTDWVGRRRFPMKREVLEFSVDGATPAEVRSALAEIAGWCADEGRPPLASLVVEHGLAAETAEQRSALQVDWSAIPNPFA